MIKLAYNKVKPNLVFKINSIVRHKIGSFGIVEYYKGDLVDTSTVPDTKIEGYEVQVMGFESEWSETPVDLGSTGNINNQTKECTPTTSSQNITPDTGYTGLDKVTVAAVTSAIDENILPENIKAGVTILGVEGTYTGEEE